jgi:hypothetical protein
MTAPSPTVAEKKSFKDWQYDFTAHIRDPENVPTPAGMEERRIRIYNELFYNNIEGFIANGFPVLRSLYSDADWHAMVRDFFKRHRNQTPYFLEVSQEFLAYLENEHEPQECDYPFMLELAHYEWVELALSIDETEIDMTAIDAEGDLLTGHPVISPLAWPLSYSYPVHQISPDFTPEQPGEQPTHIVVYRDKSDEVHFMEMNPVTARLLYLLQEDQQLSGRAALEQIARELQHPNPNIVIEGGLQTLKELQLRDIVLGTSTR